MKVSEVKVWGVDIGNVLIKNVPYSTQQYWKDKGASSAFIVNQLQLVSDALLGLRFLAQRVGPENVWVVSKANTEQRVISRLALEKFRVPLITGLKMDQVLFVTERADKLPVLKTLEVEGHIDDHGEVISSIQDAVPAPIWFNPEKKHSEDWVSKMHLNVRVVSGWQQLLQMF